MLNRRCDYPLLRDLQESSVYEESSAIQRLREDLRICQTELRYATQSLESLELSNEVINFVCDLFLTCDIFVCTAFVFFENT